MQLHNKVIFITGAASGLGAASALACAAQGAHLFLLDRDPDGLAATAEQARSSGVRVETRAGDLCQRQECFDAVADAIARFGRLDALCNIAGVTIFHRVTDVTEDDWQKTLAITLSAPFYLCQAALPELIKNHGSILNVAGSGAIKGTAYTVPYSACKAAIIHMTKCMAMEYIHEPIRINAIAPGGMKTNIMRGQTRPADLDMNLIRRFAGIRPPSEPEEIANMVVYMLSDASPSLHGSIVSVDSGISAG